MTASAKAKELALIAENALRELELSVLTIADRRRCEKVRAGMRALDEEQSAAKTTIDELADLIRGLADAEGFFLPNVTALGLIEAVNMKLAFREIAP